MKYTLLVDTPSLWADGWYNPFLAHVVEHCLWEWKEVNIKTFFEKNIIVDYTFCEFYTKIEYNQDHWFIKNLLQKDLDKTVIKKEKKLLDEEESEYELKRAILDRLHTLPNYNRSLSISNIINYYIKYYQKEFSYSILEKTKNWYKIIENNYIKPNYVNNDINWSFKQNDNIIYYSSIGILWIYAKQFFLSELLNSFSRYYYRYYLREKYYYPEVIFSHSHIYWYIIIPDYFLRDIIENILMLESFYIKFKKNILTIINKEYDKEWILTHFMKQGKMLEEKDLIHEIKKIDFNDIKNILIDLQ